VTVAGRVFLTWEQESPTLANTHELMLQELTWDDVSGLSIARELSLGVIAPDNEGASALGTSSLFPEGAVLVGWRQAASDPASQADLRWLLRPVPWIELGP
jgi:hypothetical protein